MNGGYIFLLVIGSIIVYLALGCASIRVWNWTWPHWKPGLRIKPPEGSGDVEAWGGHLLTWPLWWLGMLLFGMLFFPVRHSYRWGVMLTGLRKDTE